MARRTKDNAIPWDLIEKRWRLGVSTASQLAEEFGVAVSSITRRAKEKGWVQDKREEVDLTRESLLIQNASGKSNPNATPSAFEVQVAAQQQVDVVLQHRQGLARLKVTQAKLLAQIEAAVDHMPDILELIEIIRQPNEQGVDRVNDAMRRIMERPALVDDLKKLTEIDEKIRKGEREAHGLDKEKSGSTVEDLLASIGAAAKD